VTGTGPVPLWLDHASIAVPDLPAAAEDLHEKLGLAATISPAAPERHSRVCLDRTYLEVAADAGRVGWQATMCFLRFADPDALRAHLDATNLSYTFGAWEGVDGTWDDVEVRSGGVHLPTLIRRTAPVDVARDWPPALSGSHRCGARSLVAVHLEVPSLDAAAEAFSRLVGTSLSSATAGAAVRVPLASGELVAAVGATSNHPDVKPLIPNALEAGLTALRTRGHYPINHLVVVRDELLDAHPDLAADVFETFAAAKNLYVEDLKAGRIDNPTDVDEVHRRVMEITGNPLPYGLEPNRAALEELIRHATTQAIEARNLSPDK